MTADTLLSCVELVMIFYGVPWVVTELFIWKSTAPGNRKGAIWFRLLCFIASVLVAGAWIGYVFHVAHVGMFTVVHTIGAGLSGVIGVALLTYLGARKIKPRVAVTSIAAFYSALGIGAAFGIYGSSTDITGLWGVGLLMVAVCSLAACFLVATLTAALTYRT